MMASKMLVVDEFQGKHHESRFKVVGFILDEVDKFFKGLENTYRRVLKWSLHHKKTVVFTAIVILRSAFCQRP